MAFFAYAKRRVSHEVATNCLTAKCEITTNERNKLSVMPIKWAGQREFNFGYVH